MNVWFDKLDTDRIRIFLCKECGVWGVDADW
jgi:hypothetical protein